MIRLFKRIKCKHRWQKIKIHAAVKEVVYGCGKCGLVKVVYTYDVEEFHFKRTIKGETFE